MRPILSEDERARIDAAIATAERDTRGEIVPVIVRAADDYPGARWRLAVAFTVAVTAVGLVLAPVHALWILVAQVPALLLGHWLATRPALLRLALRSDKLDEEVKQRAHQAFFELGLSQTQERTGVLLFVALLEHRIEIIADSGINGTAPTGFWSDVVAGLAARLRRGELAEGVVEAVEACGKLMAEHFPRQGGERNELPDRVITD